MNPGGYSSFGSTGFGSSNTSGLFGASQPAQTSLFGSSATQPTQGTSLFSGGSSGFGGFSSGASTSLSGAQVTGTTVKFAAPSGQDTINKNGSAQTINTNHQCITAMKEYKAKSLEELRYEDYQANRKTAQQTSTFGSSTGTGLFGSSTPASTASTGFGGGTSLFGGSSSTSTTFGGSKLFGSTTAAAPASTGLFGQPTQPAQPATSFFGASSTPATTTTGFGGFGQQTQPTSTSVFGQTQAAAKPSIFGGLGQTTTQPSTGLFGSTTPAASTTTGGIFGQQAAKPTFGGFGSTTTATQPAQSSPFSFNAQPATNTATPSIFGGASTTQSPLGAAKPFGSGFGLTSSTSTGFGQTAAAQPATGGGIFGSTVTKPAFGSTTTSGFGGFGQTTTAAAQPASGGIFGGFGSTATTTTATTTPFGSSQPAATASPFGSTQASGGLFGSSTAQPAATTTGFGSGLSVFGATTGTTGLGSGLGTTGISGGLFGNTATSAQPASQFSFGGTGGAAGSSFLGGGANTSLTGGFGGGLTTGQNTSLGGLNTQQQQQLQQQTQNSGMDPNVVQQISALSNSPYGSSYHHVKKDSEIFNPVSPLAQRQYIAEATSPTKVSSLISSGEVKGGLSQSIRIAPKPLSTISLNKKTNLFEGLEDEEVPCFYPRKNIKKLLFKPTCNLTQNNSGRSSPSNSISGGDYKSLDFMRKSNYPDQEENKSGLARFNQSDYYNQSHPPDQTNISDDGQQIDNQSEASNQPMVQHPANVCLERPGYFTIPSLQELATMTDSKGDCLVENFSIGRVDYGCITFPGVTNIANMNFDEIVHIRRKEVHIYPDENKKPPVGQGLNKTAEVVLHRIWPTDKETKKPVTDPNRVIEMGYNKKIERATAEMGTQFVDYDPTTGSWTFRVKHFSKYGLHDSDDDDNVVGVHVTNPIKACNQASGFLVKDRPKEGEIDAKTEKDMIQKQLKLIETRRLELMQQRKFQHGNNLNTITNQQWEMLNEYVPTSNALHLELSESSSSSQIVTSSHTDDEDTVDKASTNSSELKKKSLRKMLVLDNETDDTDTDYDKENAALFPNLAEFRNKKGNKKSLKDDRLYPNLHGFETNEMYQNKEMGNFQMEQEDMKHTLHHGDAMNEDDQMNGLPFVVAASNDRMLASTRANKTLMKAFFGEEQVTEEYMTTLEEDTKMKIGSLVHKPQQFGLLKRGLGGMSNEELLESKRNTIKREPYQAKQIPAKITAMCLTLADVQQRIGSKNLKPKKFNKFSTRANKPTLSLNKHNHQELVETIESDTTQLKSLKLNEMHKPGEDLGGIQLRYVDLDESVLKRMQGCVADAALFQSRRFRVNWALNPTACTYTALGLNTMGADFFIVNLMSPLMVTLENAPMLQAAPSNDLESKLSVVRANCEQFLQIQLGLSEVQKSQNLGLFRSKPGNTLIKNCCEYVQKMRNTIGDHPDADNIEHMKSVWSLCQNLWGDIPEAYKIESSGLEYNHAASYEQEQIRKRLFSEWLAEVSGHRVERECKLSKFNKNKDNHLNSIFSLLTANRLLDACKLAADSSDFRLALLLAQSSGGNATFRNMIKKQIKEWLISGTDKYLNSDRLKFYILISGELTLNNENDDSLLINVCENLDWKRQYGLHLWYNCLPINSIHDSLLSFEQSMSRNLVNKPLPPYLEDSVTIDTDKTLSDNKNDNQQTRRELYDTCFHLIKLYCNEKYSIADIVAPLSHNVNQVDYRLSWHLAMALVAINYNSISRECLETLHESYASQLQSIGLWHWSVFVLLHIDDEKRRESAVKTYLSRYVTSESELNEKEKFLVEKLVLSAEWIYGFKALRAKYEHQHENQFKLLVKAQQWNEAHSVLIELLAPDLFMKQNFKTLNEYLTPLSKESESINKWNLGGQIYLDFIKLNQKAKCLFDFTQSNDEQIQEKLLGAELLKEINDQIISLSTRIKELKDLDCSTEKKLHVCIQISKMLVNFFNILIELNSSELNQMGDSGESDASDAKKLTKSMCDKAFNSTDSIPYHEIIQTMIMIKTKHTRTYLMSFRPY